MREIASHRLEMSDQMVNEVLGMTSRILKSGQVVLGPVAKQFESEYAKALGREHGVAVSSDTAAFEILLKIIGVQNEYVLYPALGFASLLESVRNAGGKPWFVDMPPASEPSGLFATVEMLEDAVQECERVTNRTPKALILMHTGGLLAGQSAKIEAWCRERGIVCFEDAAHAFGATVDGRKAGSFGVASAFSLYATKPMHSMEGGMIVTDDERVAEEARVYRNYGRIADFGRSVIVRHGYSWRMPEISAAVGLVNLHNIDTNLARRRRIMATYDTLIGAMTDRFAATKVPVPAGMTPNGYRYLLLLPEGATYDDRLKFKEVVKGKYGIDLPGEVYELPSHRQPIWPEYAGVSCPNSEDFCERHFALPVYPSLTEDEIAYVVQSVASALQDVGA